MTGRVWISALVAAGLLLVGCDSGDPPAPAVELGQPAVGLRQVQAHLAAAREAWQAAAIEDYALTYEMRCFCPITSVSAVVRNGQVTDFRPADGREILIVPDMFARIDEALRDRPADIRATFDAATGVPIEFHVDPEANVADEEWGLTVQFDPDGSLPGLPESVDAADLTQTWGCGHGFHVGNDDQTVAVHVIPEAVDDLDHGPLPGAVVPSAAYTVEANIGEDLFANWCDDVIEPEEPTPLVVEDWPAVDGQIEVVTQPTGPCGGGAVTITITGLVLERPDGERIDVGDLTITNDTWGCFAG